MPMFDVLITNGLVVDGTGQPAFAADVAINGERIVAVGDLAQAEAGRTIDATGMVVSPGFIDIHTHSDLTLLVEPFGMSKIRQGVTTEVSGNCGYSPYPVAPDHADELRELLSSGLHGESVDWVWSDLAGYRDFAAERGLGMNVAPLVGHGAVRGAVVGFEDRRATADDVAGMQRLVSESMEQGAFGLSTGLTLTPSAYGDTEEIVALAEAMSHFPGRFYTSHTRLWAGWHIKGVAEAIDIGRRANVPVQVSHMAVNDPPYWGQADTVIAVCEDAVTDGFDVTFDVYPYAASSSGFAQCIPTWAQSGGTQALLQRLRNPNERARIRADMLEEGLFRGWPWLWDRLQVSAAHTREVSEFEGMSFEQAGEKMGLEPIDAALTLMERDEAKLRIIFYYRTEEDMKSFLRHPMGMMGSDGLAIQASGPLGAGRPHPRSYGAHSRVLGLYVRDTAVLTMEEAVHKMSGQVATRLGMSDRGVIAAGNIADIAIFDPDTVADRASFEDPHQYAVGVPYVLVNGEVVVAEGEHTGALPGRVLAA
ncbi:MAG: D-aminoacylase [Ilumatobacteraceae bacterium]|nr:D-aminoacylase [Ilumatobacteraceae bacterium]